MGGTASKTNKKLYAKVIAFGIVSVVLYAAVFTHEAFVRETWAKGGVYAVLPLITVFLFSYIHGSFANHLMTSLGMTAKKH